jgi:hypothetical protein
MKTTATGVMAVALLFTAPTANAISQFVNGGFETGDTTGWIANNVNIANNPTHPSAFTATFDGSAENSSLRQILSSNAHDTSFYSLSFSLRVDPAKPGEEGLRTLLMTWAGSVVGAWSDASPFGFQSIAMTVVPKFGYDNTHISFTLLGPVTANPFGFHLDDFAIRPLDDDSAESTHGSTRTLIGSTGLPPSTALPMPGSSTPSSSGRFAADAVSSVPDSVPTAWALLPLTLALFAAHRRVKATPEHAAN